MLQKQFSWNSVNVLFFLYFVYSINSAYIFSYCLNKIEFYMHTHANHSSLWRMLFQTVSPFDTSNSSLLWPSPSRLWEGELFCLPKTVNERTEEDEGKLVSSTQTENFKPSSSQNAGAMKGVERASCYARHPLRLLQWDGRFHIQSKECWKVQSKSRQNRRESNAYGTPLLSRTALSGSSALHTAQRNILQL